jgi:hypothetical protein
MVDDTKEPKSADGVEKTRIGSSSSPEPKVGDGVADLLAKQLVSQNKERKEQRRDNTYTVPGARGPVRRRFRTTSEFERQDVTAGKSLSQLMAERVAGGESMGSAFGASISEKTKARASRFTRKFDPINLINKIPLIGTSLAASYARKNDRLGDFSYLTGVTPRINPIDDMDEESPSMSPGITQKLQTASKISEGTSAGSLAPIMQVVAKNTMALPGISRDINVIRQNIGKITEHFGIKAATKADMHMLKERELGEKASVQTGYGSENVLSPKSGSASSDEEREQEELKRHNELIEAIKGIGTNKQTASKEKDEKKGGLMGMVSGLMGGAGTAIKGLAGMAKSLIALAASLWIISKALQNFANIDLASIGKGILTLAALAATTRLLKKVDAWKSLLALGASLWIVSKALDNFADIEWESIAKGIVAIGSLAATTKLLSGGMGSALALIVLAGGVWAISKALQSFSELDWSTIVKGITTVGILAAGAAAISGFALPIAATAAAIGLLGGAIWVLGKGLESISEGFDSFIENFEKLGKIDGVGLLKTAAGITALSVAMLAFGTAQMVTALQNLVTNFLSLGQDSPVEQLQKIGEAGPGIQKAADGMERLAEAMSKFADVDSDQLEKVLKTLDKFPVMKKSIFERVFGTSNSPSTTTSSSATKVKTTPVSSGTLTGVSSQDIQSHPKFQQYYQEALSINPNNKQAAYQEASMRVKEEMVKAKPVSQAQPLAARMNSSVKENVALTSQTSMMQSPTIVNAPKTTVVNNSTLGGGGGAGVRLRNDEPILTRLQYQNVRPV